MTDLIRRQVVLMSLADYQLQESPNWGANGMGNTDAYEAITECIRVIEQAPTIDPEKHGKWIELSEAEYKCSACGSWYGGEYGDEVPTEYAFCPRCGARMERSEDGET